MLNSYKPTLNKGTTIQITLKTQNNQYAIGFIFKDLHISDDCPNCTFSYDNNNWSKTWTTYEQAVSRLLISLNFPLSYKDTYILPIPEIYNKLWRPINIPTLFQIKH